MPHARTGRGPQWMAHGGSGPLIRNRASLTRVTPRFVTPLHPPCCIPRSTLALECPVIQLPSNRSLLVQKKLHKNRTESTPGPALAFLKRIRMAARLDLSPPSLHNSSIGYTRRPLRLCHHGVAAFSESVGVSRQGTVETSSFRVTEPPGPRGSSFLVRIVASAVARHLRRPRTPPNAVPLGPQDSTCSS